MCTSFISLGPRSAPPPASLVALGPQSASTLQDSNPLKQTLLRLLCHSQIQQLSPSPVLGHPSRLLLVPPPLCAYLPARPSPRTAAFVHSSRSLRTSPPSPLIPQSGPALSPSKRSSRSCPRGLVQGLPRSTSPPPSLNRLDEHPSRPPTVSSTPLPFKDDARSRSWSLG